MENDAQLFRSNIKRSILDLVPYKPATVNSDCLRLDWNETYFKNPIVERYLKTFDIHFNRYPDPEAQELTQKIAEYCGVDYENVLTFPGLDTALDSALRIFDLDFDYNVFEYGKFGMLERLNRNHSQRRGFYFSSPNNPSGKLYSVNDFKADFYFIDQAYIEFTQNVKIDSIPDNVLYFRSFSKAFGLAGLRLGYVVGHKDYIKQLRKLRNGKDITDIAQKAGVLSLSNIDLVQDHVREVIETREWFIRKVRDLGFKCEPSHANFVWLPHRIYTELLESKIQVRDFAWGVRITIGTIEQMERVLFGLSRIRIQSKI